MLRSVTMIWALVVLSTATLLQPAAAQSPPVLKGDTYAIKKLLFSPDSTKLASVGGKTLIWDLATGEGTPIIASEPAPFLSFSGDSKTLIAASRQQGGAWDVASGTGKAQFAGELLAASTNGQTAITRAFPNGGRATVWDVATGQARFTLDAAIDKAAVSADGRLAAIGLRNEIRLVDVASGKEKTGIKGLTGIIYSLNFSADGSVLLINGGGNATFWNVSTPGAPQLRQRESIASTYQMEFLADGRTLAYHQNGKIHLWDLAGRKLRASFPGTTPFSPSADGKMIAAPVLTAYDAARLPQKIALADVATGQIKTILEGKLGEFAGAVALSPNRKLLAIGGNDGSIHVRSLGAGAAGGAPAAGIKEIAHLPLAPRFNPTGLEFSLDGRYLRAQDGSTLECFDVLGKKSALRMKQPHSSMFLPDGKTLFAFHALEGPVGNAEYFPWNCFYYNLATGQRQQDKKDRKAYFIVRSSPDGKQAAAYLANRLAQSNPRSDSQTAPKARIAILDMSSGKETAVLWEGVNQLVRSGNEFAFSPDGQRLAVRNGNELKVHDLAKKMEIPTVAEWQQFRNGVVFVDNQTVAGLWLETGATLYDLTTGQEKGKVDLRKGHTGRVSAAAFSLAAPLFATVGDNGEALVHDLATSEVLARLPGHEGKLTAVAFSSNGRLLASADAKAIKIWEIGDLRPQAALPGEAAVPKVAPKTPQPLTSIEPKEYASFNLLVGGGDFDKIRFSKDGNIVAIGERGRIHVIDIPAKKIIFPTAGSPRLGDTPILSPDGRILAAHTHDTTRPADQQGFAGVDLTTGKSLPNLAPKLSGPTAADFSPDGKFLALGQDLSNEEGSIVSLFDTRTFTRQAELKGYKAAVHQLKYTPDGSEIVVTILDKNGNRLFGLHPKTLAQRGPIAKLEGSPGSSYRSSPLWLSPDGALVVGAKERATDTEMWSLMFWERQTGKVRANFKPEGYHFVSFVGNLPLVAFASGPARLEVWDVNAGQLRHKIDMHETHKIDGSKYVNSYDVAFSGDGRIMASGNEVGNIRFWDLVTGRLLGKHAAHRDQILYTAFSPDGRFLVTTGADKKCTIWSLR